MTVDRFRKRHTFWLNILKDDEYKLAEELEVLKQKRLYTPTLRDALRLIFDLRKGNIEVLLELFPHIKKKLLESYDVKSPQSKPQNGTQTYNLNEALQTQINRLEKLLEENSVSFGQSLKHSSPVIQSKRQIDVGEENTSITVTKATKTSSSSAQNFMDSMSMFG